MTLSICCISYNHEKFIRQAIEGFLIQQTNFDVEIIISDDASKDLTQEICKEFKNLYPEKFKLFLNQDNIGMIPNFVQALNACSGKYIALCEGDDYWTDPKKLQMQVDFLEANPNYSICFHAVNIKEYSKDLVPSIFNPSNKEETFSILDLTNKITIHTGSVVFRNGLINEFPAWFATAPAGDYVLQLLIAKKGLIKYFPNSMAVYRIHDGGVWSQKSIGINHPKWIELLENLINEDFQPNVIENLSLQKQKFLDEYIQWLINNKNYNLINETIKKYNNSKSTIEVELITNTLIKHITSLEHYIKGVQSTKSYGFAKKLSAMKSNLFSLITTRANK